MQFVRFGGRFVPVRVREVHIQTFGPERIGIVLTGVVDVSESGHAVYRPVESPPDEPVAILHDRLIFGVDEVERDDLAEVAAALRLDSLVVVVDVDRTAVVELARHLHLVDGVVVDGVLDRFFVDDRVNDVGEVVDRLPLAQLLDVRDLRDLQTSHFYKLRTDDERTVVVGVVGGRRADGVRHRRDRRVLTVVVQKIGVQIGEIKLVQREGVVHRGVVAERVLTVTSVDVAISDILVDAGIPVVVLPADEFYGGGRRGQFERQDRVVPIVVVVFVRRHVAIQHLEVFHRGVDHISGGYRVRRPGRLGYREVPAVLRIVSGGVLPRQSDVGAVGRARQNGIVVDAADCRRLVGHREGGYGGVGGYRAVLVDVRFRPNCARGPTVPVRTVVIVQFVDDHDVDDRHIDGEDFQFYRLGADRTDLGDFFHDSFGVLRGHIESVIGYRPRRREPDVQFGEGVVFIDVPADEHVSRRRGGRGQSETAVVLGVHKGVVLRIFRRRRRVLVGVDPVEGDPLRTLIRRVGIAVLHRLRGRFVDDAVIDAVGRFVGELDAVADLIDTVELKTDLHIPFHDDFVNGLGRRGLGGVQFDREPVAVVVDEGVRIVLQPLVGPGLEDDVAGGNGAVVVDLTDEQTTENKVLSRLDGDDDLLADGRGGVIDVSGRGLDGAGVKQYVAAVGAVRSAVRRLAESDATVHVVDYVQFGKGVYLFAFALVDGSPRRVVGLEPGVDVKRHFGIFFIDRIVGREDRAGLPGRSRRVGILEADEVADQHGIDVGVDHFAGAVVVFVGQFGAVLVRLDGGVATILVVFTGRGNVLERVRDMHGHRGLLFEDDPELSVAGRVDGVTQGVFRHAGVVDATFDPDAVDVVDDLDKGAVAQLFRHVHLVAEFGVELDADGGEVLVHTAVDEGLRNASGHDADLVMPRQTVVGHDPLRLRPEGGIEGPESIVQGVGVGDDVDLITDDVRGKEEVHRPLVGQRVDAAQRRVVEEIVRARGEVGGDGEVSRGQPGVARSGHVVVFGARFHDEVGDFVPLEQRRLNGDGREMRRPRRRIDRQSPVDEDPQSVADAVGNAAHHIAVGVGDHFPLAQLVVDEDLHLIVDGSDLHRYDDPRKIHIVSALNKGVHDVEPNGIVVVAFSAQNGGGHRQIEPLVDDPGRAKIVPGVSVDGQAVEHEPFGRGEGIKDIPVVLGGHAERSLGADLTSVGVRYQFQQLRRLCVAVHEDFVAESVFDVQTDFRLVFHAGRVDTVDAGNERVRLDGDVHFHFQIVPDVQGRQLAGLVVESEAFSVVAEVHEVQSRRDLLAGVVGQCVVLAGRFVVDDGADGHSGIGHVVPVVGREDRQQLVVVRRFEDKNVGALPVAFQIAVHVGHTREPGRVLRVVLGGDAQKRRVVELVSKHVFFALEYGADGDVAGHVFDDQDVSYLVGLIVTEAIVHLLLVGVVAGAPLEINGVLGYFSLAADEDIL